MERRLGFVALTALLLGGAGLAPSARAQTDDDERARLHFESGRSYFEEGAYERAQQEFEQAYALSPRTAMLFNLGTTYERLGRLSQAADAFQRYVDESPDLANRDTLLRRVANLRRRAEAQAQGQEDPGDPDEHTDDGASHATTPTPHTGPSGGGGAGEGLIIGGAVALGVAGVALALTAVFGGLTLSEQSSVENGCYTAGNCAESDISNLRTYATVTDAMWITGAIAGAAGIVLLVLGITSPSDDAQASFRFNGTGFEGTF
ncbi:MAG: tetratricopeptide repeat protein [Sandaracinaceae bacterium]